jgi:acyl-coenzyme A synthetase/AMP-(fatty) acid ligase
VADAAVAMAPNKFGVDRVFCAIVPRQPFDDTAFLNYLQSDSTLRKLAAALHGICKLPAIPKGDNGKVQRRALAEEINAGLEGSGRLGLWDNGNVLLQT